LFLADGVEKNHMARVRGARKTSPSLGQAWVGFDRSRHHLIHCGAFLFWLRQEEKYPAPELNWQPTD
jgi:hypothetical protein